MEIRKNRQPGIPSQRNRLLAGTFLQCKYRHLGWYFLAFFPIIMLEPIANRLLASFSVATPEDQHYVLSTIKPEYFADPVMGDVFRAARTLVLADSNICPNSIAKVLLTDADSPKIKRLREYFVNSGKLPSDCKDSDVKRYLPIYFVDLTSAIVQDPPRFLVEEFMTDYIRREERKLLLRGGEVLGESSFATLPKELFRKMRELEELDLGSSWRQYALDIDQLLDTPDDIPVISRKGKGLLFRQSICLLSANPGCCKSLLALTMSAAVLKAGRDSDSTLGFSSINHEMSVLYADTELGNNTLKNRMLSLQKMLGRRPSREHFQYLRLRAQRGGPEARWRTLSSACRDFHPDLIVMDNLKDFCRNFNDAEEAKDLLDSIKVLSEDTNSAVLMTSHLALGLGNPKGHLGVGANEACSLGISLAKQENIVKALPSKVRDEGFDPFCFFFDPESWMLKEFAPTVDHREETRQFQNAQKAVSRVLEPGESIRYRDLVKRLMTQEGVKVSEKTAKNYISVLTGKMLCLNTDHTYMRYDEDPTIHFNLPQDDDFPPD